MDHRKKSVIELRKIAKQSGLVGYTRLRKAELIAKIEANQAQTRIPSHFIPISPTTSSRIEIPTQEPIPVSAVRKVFDKTKLAINTCVKAIERNIPKQPMKVVKEKFGVMQTKITSYFRKIINKPKFEIHETASAIKGFTKQYTVAGSSGIDATSFLNTVQAPVIDLLSKNRQTKTNFVLTCAMERVDMKTGEVDAKDFPFVSRTEVILESTDVNEIYNTAKDKIIESMATFQMRGSNWRLRAVQKLEINTVVYKPLKGSSYIPLPKCLASKKGIINMKNEDEECFKWCVVRALNPVEKNSERITKELIKQSEELNWTGIEFPVAADANVISKFERNNNISINVFGYENDVNLFPIYVSKHESEFSVDLLLISDEEKKHYCWIKNFNRLMAVHGEKSYTSMHYCKRCLQGYRDVGSLRKHVEYCSQHEAQKIELPEPGTMLSFKNYYRKMRVPFVVYADFESFIKPIDTCQPDPNTSYTNKYQKHVPSSFCYYIKCFDDNLYSQAPVMFTAENEDDDVAQIFIDTLIENIKDIYKRFKFPKQMIFRRKDKELYDSATVCHICEGELGVDRVRDHCHLTGKYRGAAHNSCNLSYKVPKFFPVVLHNLSCYDAHLFVKRLRGDNNEKINCIPCNEERYISFSREVIVDKFINKENKEVEVKRELRFIDSFRFMPSSLDALSKNLSKDQCKNISKHYTGNQLDLLLRKGAYPYDYVDTIDRLNETELPPKSAFYSRLNDSDISDEDYEHAKTVWNEFGFKTFREYHDLYNLSDVLLLADVFENFRDVCCKNYGPRPRLVLYFSRSSMGCCIKVDWSRVGVVERLRYDTNG